RTTTASTSPWPARRMRWCSASTASRPGTSPAPSSRCRRTRRCDQPQRLMGEKPSRADWQALYGRLRECLAALGKHDASGNGDYWIVDDDWGGHHHKVCITNPTFWSPSAESAIRETLAPSPNWGVYVVFEFKPKQPGLIVYADGLVTEPGEPRWP